MLLEISYMFHSPSIFFIAVAIASLAFVSQPPQEQEVAFCCHLPLYFPWCSSWFKNDLSEQLNFRLLSRAK